MYLFAYRFIDSDRLDNLVAMSDCVVNQNTYKKLENLWVKTLKKV